MLQQNIFSYTTDVPPLCIVLVFAGPNFDGFLCMVKHIWCYFITYFLPSITDSRMGLYIYIYIFTLCAVGHIGGPWELWISHLEKNHTISLVQRRG